MISVVQGFDVGSPLPIDGRILLTKAEMIGNYYDDLDEDTGEFDKINLDNILPDHYFAFCKDGSDNRLYLFDKSIPYDPENPKNDPETGEYGKFVLANKELIDLINTTKNTLDNSISNLNTRVDTTNSNLNTEVARLDSRVDDLSEDTNERFETTSDSITVLDGRLDDIEPYVYGSPEIESFDTKLGNLDNKLTDAINTVDEKIEDQDDGIRKQLTNEVTTRTNQYNDLVAKDVDLDSKIDQLNSEIDGFKDSVAESFSDVNSSIEETNINLSNLTDIVSNEEDGLVKQVSDLTDRANTTDSEIGTIKSNIEKIAGTDVDNPGGHIGEINSNINTINTRLGSVGDNLESINSSIVDIIGNRDESFDPDNPLTYGGYIGEEVKRAVAKEAELETSITNVDSKVNDITKEDGILQSYIDKSLVDSVTVTTDLNNGILSTSFYNLWKKDGQGATQTPIPIASTENAGLMTANHVNAIDRLNKAVARISGDNLTYFYQDTSTINEATDSEGSKYLYFSVSYVKDTVDDQGNVVKVPYKVIYEISSDYSKINVLHDAEISPSLLPENISFDLMLDDATGLYLTNIYENTYTVDSVTGEITVDDVPIVDSGDHLRASSLYKLDLEAMKVYRDGVETNDIHNISSFAINNRWSWPYVGISILAMSFDDSSEGTYHTWRYYDNFEDGQIVGWKDLGKGVIDMSPFSNTTIGGIVGTNSPGYVYAEADGRGAVVGWDDVQTKLNNLLGEGWTPSEPVGGILATKADKTELDTKVDKKEGYSLISDAEKSRLDGVVDNADRVEKSAENGNITKVYRVYDNDEGIWKNYGQDINVYTHPFGYESMSPVGFYTFATDDTSHIRELHPVTVKDITDINSYLPGRGLTYYKNESTGTVRFEVDKYKFVEIDLAQAKNWQKVNNLYEGEVAIASVTEDSEPIISLDMTQHLNNIDIARDEWSKIVAAEALNGKIKFYANEQLDNSKLSSLKLIIKLL